MDSLEVRFGVVQVFVHFCAEAAGSVSDVGNLVGLAESFLVA